MYTLTDSDTAFFNSYKADFLSGTIPFASLGSGSVSALELIPTGNKENDLQDSVCSNLLLDKSKAVSFYDKLLAVIKNESTSYSKTDEHYLMTKFIEKQIQFFQLSLQIVNSDSELRTEILRNGHEIIENLTNNIHFVIKLLKSSDCSTIVNNLNLLLLHLLNYFIHVTVNSVKGFSTRSVVNWFKLMNSSDYLTLIHGTNTLMLDFNHQTISSLATLISLLFLDLDFNKGSLDENDASFMASAETLVEINELISSAKPNPLVIYAWSIILHRQHLFLQTNQEHPKYGSYMEKVVSSKLKNLEMMYLKFINDASLQNFAEILVLCNNLISYDDLFPNILGSFVINFIPYIEPTDGLINSISIIMKKCSNSLVQSFFENEFTNEMLVLLKAKLPLSLNSYLKLVSINSNLSIEELNSLPTFTTYVDSKSINFMIDDQQPELIKLVDDVNFFLPYDNQLSLCIKKDSKAQILLKNKDQSLVMFLHEFNGWALLGRILNNLSNKIVNDSNTDKINSRLCILSSIRDIFRDLPATDISIIIKSMNSFIDETQFDIIDILFKISDQSLYMKDSELATTCIKLFSVLSLKGYDYRIWSYLYTSKLFNLETNGGLVYEILDKIEISSGKYDLLLALMVLGTTLLDLSLHKNSVNVNLKSEILNYFTVLNIKVFQNFNIWKFEDINQKSRIGFLILDFFNRIMKFESKITQSSYEKINPVYYSSFIKITQNFLIFQIDDSKLLDPLLDVFTLLDNPSFKPYNSRQWFAESFEFASSLIRFRNILHPDHPSNLEKNLFTRLNQIINSYLLNDSFRLPIVRLLSALLSANWNNNPPSMLTHLSLNHQFILLNIFNDTLSNSTCTDFNIEVLKLISNILTSDQKGLSLFLITGKSFEKNKPDSIDCKLSIVNLFRSTILSLSNVSHCELSYWLLNSYYACINIKTDLITAEDIKLVEKLLLIVKENKNNKIVSKSIDIISLYLFVSKDTTMIKKIVDFLNDDALIDDLTKIFRIHERDEAFFSMFKTKFESSGNGTQITLDDFILKKDSVYSMEKVLGTDNVKESIKPDYVQLLDDIEKVENAIQLAKSYGGLLTCFCNVKPELVSVKYYSFASELLKINYREGIPSDSYEVIFRGRIELSFLITLTLKNMNKEVEDKVLLSIISSTLKVLQSRQIDLFKSLTNLNVNYYKPLLRILLIALSLIKTTNFVTEYSSTLLDVFKNIICKSINILFVDIRNVATSTHLKEFGNSYIMNKQIDDMLLILSNMKQFFKLKLNDNLERMISEIIVNSGIYKNISTLFQISHLIKFNDNEILADYSLLFIYELIQKKFIAEKLINEGIFNLLTDSPICEIISNGNLSLMSSNSTILNVYKLWVNRILPIIVTILSQFDVKILNQLIRFVLHYQKQFNFTIQSWMNTNMTINELFIEETDQIIMIAKMLNNLDCYNYLSIKLNKPTSEIKLLPGLDNISQRKEFVNILNYLLSHPKYLSSKIMKNEALTPEKVIEELNDLKNSLLV